MTKYGKDVLLTASEENKFRTTRLSVSDCDTKEEADEKLLKWIKESPELLAITGNKKIVDAVLSE